MYNNIAEHYNILIEKDNDSYRDPPELQEYMNKWDGKVFIDLLNANKNSNILEIGIGTGRLACKVSPLCNRLCGIDLSHKTIERAKENLNRFRNIDFICDDFMTHKFVSKFDIIYSSLTFMHIKEKQQAINKIYSLLNDNGRFVLSIDKNQDNIIDAGYSKIEIYPDTPPNITNCMNLCGFIIKTICETDFAYIFVAKK